MNPEYNTASAAASDAAPAPYSRPSPRFVLELLDRL